ncbi:MAG TPA: hypothetical protein VLC06_18780 [Polyangia bacterium]|jgi:hypothetical protein|nr:hypothetical protein [Polyangia bacterium]
MRLSALGLSAALALTGACAHRPEEPAATVAAFGAALAHGDLRAAYQLTSLEFQHQMPYEAFAAGLAAAGGEPAALGGRLIAEAATVAPRVEVTLALGEQVPLVLEGGRWRIDGPVYEAWGQATPRAAVRTFVRALDAHRYDVVLRLVPERYRVGLSAARLRTFWEGDHPDEHQRLLARIRAAVHGPLTETGDEARLSVAPDGEMRLVREAGQWKIEDPEEILTRNP